jgi:hypothetical protein
MGWLWACGAGKSHLEGAPGRIAWREARVRAHSHEIIQTPVGRGSVGCTGSHMRPGGVRSDGAGRWTSDLDAGQVRAGHRQL